jgi:predicted DNA-binding transcriptional regulator AlpA
MAASKPTHGAMSMATNNPAQSVADFCKSFGISRSFFYKLQRAGKAPRVMKIGRRTLVSAEAASEWQKQMEGNA